MNRTIGASAVPSVVREVMTAPAGAPEACLSLLCVAQTYHDSGFWDQAIDTYAVALETWQNLANEGTVPAFSPEDVESWFKMASGTVYQSMGDDDAAMQAFQEASSLTTTALLKASACACCAAVYHHAQAYAEARPLFVETLQTRLAFDAEAVDIAGAENNLAATLYAMGDVAQSLDLLQSAISRLKNSVGANHPRFVIVQRNLDMIKKFQLQSFKFVAPEIKPITIPKGMIATAGGGGKGKKGKAKKGGKKKKK
eukprot:ANDGO_00722.mRNA.1 hypothetical protein